MSWDYKRQFSTTRVRTFRVTDLVMSYSDSSSSNVYIESTDIEEQDGTDFEEQDDRNIEEQADTNIETQDESNVIDFELQANITSNDNVSTPTIEIIDNTGDIQTIEVMRNDFDLIIEYIQTLTVNAKELSMIWDTRPQPIEQWTSICTQQYLPIILSNWMRPLCIVIDVVTLIGYYIFENTQRYEFTVCNCGKPYQILNLKYVFMEAYNHRTGSVQHLLWAFHREYKRICFMLNLDVDRILKKYS